MSTKVNAKRLKRQMALRGWTGQELADRANLSAATISAALQGREVSNWTVRKIALALFQAPVIPGADLLLEDDNDDLAL